MIRRVAGAGKELELASLEPRLDHRQSQQDTASAEEFAIATDSDCREVVAAMRLLLRRRWDAAAWTARRD